MSVVPVSMIVSISLALAILGCGDPEVETTNSRDDRPRTAKTTADRPSSSDDRSAGLATSDSRDAIEGGRAITKDSGAVYVPPAAPTAATTAPGRGCRVREERSGSRTLRVAFPPVPGISAVRVGGAVRVDYRFGPVPRRCAPVLLEVTLDVNDDSLPGRSESVGIRANRGQVRVEVPEDMPNVDVARVVARTNRGAPSDAAAVPVR